MKIYLAAMYSRAEEMREYAKKLQELGQEITSTWIFGSEEGKTPEQNALMDIEDIDRADTIISFTHPRGTMMPAGGGRHIEFGYGYAKGKNLVNIGPRESVFHSLPGVQVFPDLETWISLYASPAN